jgi:hypothetical protein
MRFLAKLHGWAVVQRMRSQPLWEVGSERPAAQRQQPAPSPVPDRADLLASILHTASAGPPSVAAVAQALVDIGATEQQEALLWTVAEHLAELGLNSADQRDISEQPWDTQS